MTNTARPTVNCVPQVTVVHPKPVRLQPVQMASTPSAAWLPVRTAPRATSAPVEAPRSQDPAHLALLRPKAKQAAALPALTAKVAISYMTQPKTLALLELITKLAQRMD